MINLKTVLLSESVLKALTSFKSKDFLSLAANFDKNIKGTFKNKRNVDINRGRPFILSTAEEKLFFILFYLKCHPTFAVSGSIFNVNRATCCRWVNWFLPALKAPVGKKLTLPKRKIRSKEDLMRLFPVIKDILPKFKKSEMQKSRITLARRTIKKARK